MRTPPSPEALGEVGAIVDRIMVGPEETRIGLVVVVVVQTPEGPASRWAAAPLESWESLRDVLRRGLEEE